jgi:hypothetical protein
MTTTSGIFSEKQIPSRDPSTLPPIDETRTYVISARVQDGLVQYYFSSKPASPAFPDDQPLLIRVPDNCRIVLELDTALQWQFRSNGDAVTLGSTARSFYYNLVLEAPQRLSFYALFNDNNDYVNNRDPYNIYIELTQAGTSQLLAIRIDPDIENPGTHH